jgi:hypothetical protein
MSSNGSPLSLEQNVLSDLPVFDSFGADIWSETELMFEMVGDKVVLEVRFVFHDLSGLFACRLVRLLWVSMTHTIWVLPPFEHILSQPVSDRVWHVAFVHDPLKSAPIAGLTHPHFEFYRKD